MGRKRIYCGSTCRSAARRRRAEKASVTPGLTTAACKADIDSVSSTIREMLKTLAHADLDAGPDIESAARSGAPLAAVAAARNLSQLADDLLRAAVERGRATGRTWQEIGEVLGTTRQAAFQRFGRPLDPRTGAPMADNILPGAAARATALLADLAAGDHAAARRDFSDEMAHRLDIQRLSAAWAHVVGMAGGYEGMGAAHAYQAGDLTVVDVALSFEAGEVTGRVSYGKDGRVAGLWLLPNRSHR